MHYLPLGLIILHLTNPQGNTVIIIEHNLAIIKNADYLIDLGPDGGEKGGFLLAVGSPEEVKNNTQSITGKFL